MARQADVVKRQVTLDGLAARELAALLGLPLDKASTLELAVPETLSKTRRNTAHWDPKHGRLILGEHWFDARTAFPHEAGPAFHFVSPPLDGQGAPPGWGPLLRALEASPAANEGSWGLVHARRWAVRADLHACVRLLPKTWEGGPRVLTIEAGPPIDATPPSDLD